VAVLSEVPAVSAVLGVVAAGAASVLPGIRLCSADIIAATSGLRRPGPSLRGGGGALPASLAESCARRGACATGLVPAAAFVPGEMLARLVMKGSLRPRVT
jgi:hypothetical protein